MKSYSKKAKRNILTGSMVVPSIMVLTMITISSCTSFDPDNPEDVMNKLADTYAERIYDLGYIAPALYAETAKVDGVYGNLTLKKGYLHSAGYDCLIPVANFSFIASEIAKSNRSDDWLAYLTNTYDILDYEHVSDIQPIIQSSFTMVRFFEQRAVLADPQSFDLELVPDQRTIRFKDRESSAYTGEIQYDTEHNITKISLDRIPFYQPVFQNWITVQAEISFKKQQNRLFINEITLEHNTEGVDYKSSIIVEEAVELNRLVSDREFKILEQYKQNPLVEYNGSSLTEYTNNFNWLSAESLKEDLEAQVPLEDQFNQNSGKPYRDLIHNQRGNMTPLYENEIYPEIRSLLRYMETLAGTEDSEYRSTSANLIIDNRIRNYGTLASGSVIKSKFNVRNSGNETLKIYRMRSDCTISEVTIDNKEIAPGDSTNIFVQVNTFDRIGQQRYNIVLESNTEQKFHKLGLIVSVEP